MTAQSDEAVDRIVRAHGMADVPEIDEEAKSRALARLRMHMADRENGSIKMCLRDTNLHRHHVRQGVGPERPNAYRKLAQFLSEEGEASEA